MTWSPGEDPPADRFDSGERFLEWLNVQRVAAGLLIDTSVDTTTFARWFSTVMMELNGDGERLEATVAKFSADAYWARQGHPLRGLMKQWRNFVPRAQPKAAAEKHCVIPACPHPANCGSEKVSLCFAHLPEAQTWCTDRGLEFFEGGDVKWLEKVRGPM